MYRCTIVTVATYPHIHTSERIRTRTPGRRCSPLSIRRLHTLYNTIYRMSHLFLYYVFNIEYNEYNDDNNISAMNNTYI